MKPADSDWGLARSIDAARLPSHIAIIMDGNGRWASRRGLPRVAGHKAGAEAARATVDTSARMGIKTLTLYAFSVENWKRPRSEVETLWRLLHFFMGKELPTLIENDIRVTAMGRLGALPDQVREDLKAIEQSTRRNSGLQVNVALNYGGRAEIVDAVNALVEEARREGRLRDLRIDEEALRCHLYTAGLPDPELLIRTSGELRVSNFLLWQIAYSEIYVTDTLWPDFRRTDLLQAVVEYQKRDRRFGGLNVAVPRAATEEELIEALGSPAK